jgi:3-oxoacyl-[acyl-carrier protein] reductase
MSRLPGEFTDKVAIVTGAGRGIGRAYALALAGEGAAVIIADIDLASAEATAAAIAHAGGQALALGVDISDEKSTMALAEETAAHFGGIDILVNNAATYYGMRLDSMTTVEISYWNEVMSVNMNGVLLCTRAVAPFMKARGRS